MINTSNEYKVQIMENRQFRLNANISLADSTVFNLEDSTIMQGGMEFEDAVGGNSSFQIGAAIINKHTLTIDNSTGDFDTYDFTGATVVPFVGLQLSETVESLRKGFYTVDEPKAIGNLIILECLDNMHKFEVPFSEVTLNFPTTAVNALTTICAHCGVSLANVSFTGSNYVIHSRPDDEAISCLDMVAYISQIGGNNARCNTNGAVEVNWYDLSAFESEDNLDGGVFDGDLPYSTGDDADGGNFTDYSSGDSYDGGTFLAMNKYWHLYDFGSTPTVAIDDVVITGIKVENTDSENGYSVLFGTEGYILSITDNPLIQSEADAIIVSNLIGNKIVGMRFRPFNASILSNPAIEAGDPVFLSVRGRNGFNTYRGYITDLSYKVGSREQIKCEAETPSRNSSTRYSEITKTIVKARQESRNEISNYDKTVQQMTDLITNGFGMFKTESVDEAGGTIYYMHDKPIMNESSIRFFMTSTGMIEQKRIAGIWTTVSAVDNEGNALFNVITARGINADWIRTGIIASLDNSVEININNGSFSFKDSNGQALITPNGVANSDNFQATDNIASTYPLRMPFNIDDSVSIITAVKLKWTIDKFRTYSTGVSSGGGGSTTSSTDESTIFAETYSGNFSTYSGGGSSTSTGNTVAQNGVAHSHSYSTPSHDHIFSMPHTHGINVSGHDHSVYFSPHTHGVAYGILETNVTAIECKVLVDGVERATLSVTQGEIDLSTWITTPGWHTIEITSTTLKRVSAQVNIKSYIRR